MRQKYYQLPKFTLEWVASLLMFIAVSPILAALCILVKLTSKGPILYSQTRLGHHGKIIKVHKLRTMAHDCEAISGPVWSTPNDPRITPIGRFLRDTHLDELPQLWNVLRGEMSLIGPRPVRPENAGRRGQA